MFRVARRFFADLAKQNEAVNSTVSMVENSMVEQSNHIILLFL
jgi:hypothetical protein